MYQVRKDYPFYMALKVAKCFWFVELEPNKSHRLTSICKIALLLALVVFELILPLLHLIKIASVYNDISSSEDIADLIGGLGFFMICYKTMYNHEHFNKVFKDLTDTTRFGKPTTYEAGTKYCKLVSMIFLFYTSAGVTFYALLSIYESRHSACMRYQAEISEELFCTSVYPIWFPFRVNRILMFAIQIFNAVQLYTPSAQICNIVYEEVILLVSHINHLFYGLRNVFREKDKNKRIRILGRCAEYHSHIVNLALKVDELHRNISGHMTLVWAVSIGCITNQLLSMNKPAGAVLYLLGYFLGLSCFVISGQTLETESNAIAEQLYGIPWYFGSIQEQKIVMFMIMRAQIPLTLSATPFGKYGFPLYVTVVKTAYSYVTLLQNTT